MDEISIEKIDSFISDLKSKLSKEEYELLVEKLFLAITNINLPIFLVDFLNTLVRYITHKKIEINKHGWIELHNALQKAINTSDLKEKRNILTSIFISFSKYRELG